MKKFLSTSFVFLMAFVIAYAGSGVNAYSFCCDDCYTYGIEAIVEYKCCDVHKDDCSTFDQILSENTFCESSHQQCELDRLNLDLQDTSTDKKQLEQQTDNVNFPLTIVIHSIIQNLEPQFRADCISETQKPPNLSTLAYFSLLETLII
ncbi:MAG TPA: hypothetical protein VLZ33_06285 [Dysgonamonadaceae bacterium]|nr:hypothetical protein [Dysgonamonadaceae bacterium]